MRERLDQRGDLCLHLRELIADAHPEGAGGLGFVEDGQSRADILQDVVAVAPVDDLE